MRSYFELYTVEKIHKFMFISIRSSSLIRINVVKLQRVQNIGPYACFRHVWTRRLRLLQVYTAYWMKMKNFSSFDNVTLLTVWMLRWSQGSNWTSLELANFMLLNNLAYKEGYSKVNEISAFQLLSLYCCVLVSSELWNDTDSICFL